MEMAKLLKHKNLLEDVADLVYQSIYVGDAFYYNNGRQLIIYIP